MHDWNRFRGNARQTGRSEDPGPTRGVVRWTLPLGRQWYAPPLVDDGRVYQVCPGRKGRKLICLDLASGDSLWEAVATREPADGALPAKLRMSSRIVASGESLFCRPLNHASIFELSRADGRVVRELRGAGSLDYRTHPAPILAGTERYLVYPIGTTAGTAPSTGRIVTRIWDTLACVDATSAEMLWSFHTGQYFGAPALDSETVYVGTAEGYLYALEVRPVDVGSGEIGSASPQRIRWSIKSDAAINGSPTLADGTLFFGANDGCVYAVDAASGTVAWKTYVGPPNAGAFIQFSAATVADGFVFIGDANEEVLQLDARSGDILDRRGTPDWVRSAPAVSGDNVVIASLDGTVACVSASALAETRWSRRLNRWHLTCDPVIAGDYVLVVTSDMTLWCLALADGTTAWTTSLVEYPDDYVAFDEFQSSPCVAEGSVYIGTPGRFVYAVDARNGEPIWRREVGGEVPCDPICVDGRVYFGQQGGEARYFCVDAKSGGTIWEQNLGRVWAAANLKDGRLFVPAAEGVAYCLDAATGAILWRYPTSSDLYVAPAIDDELVYFGSWDEWLYALRSDSGELAWRFHAETYLDSGAAALTDGKLYLPTMGPRFFCLDAQSGEELWRFVPDKIWTTNASPAVSGERVVMTVFASGGMPWKPYEVNTCCLDRNNGELIWTFPAGGLNGPVIAEDRVYFASTSRGDNGFYCVDLVGNGDGTTACRFRVELGFTVLESCTAICGETAYVYAEDGYLYAIE
jgi:outer membrane protein assembly factor BamB